MGNCVDCKSEPKDGDLKDSLIAVGPPKPKVYYPRDDPDFLSDEDSDSEVQTHSKV